MTRQEMMAAAAMMIVSRFISVCKFKTLQGTKKKKDVQILPQQVLQFFPGNSDFHCSEDVWTYLVLVVDVGDSLF